MPRKAAVAVVKWIKGAVAKWPTLKMLKTAAFTVQIGQNVENSKADFKK